MPWLCLAPHLYCSWLHPTPPLHLQGVWSPNWPHIALLTINVCPSENLHIQTYNPNENPPHGIKIHFKSSSWPFCWTHTEILEPPVNGPSHSLAGHLHRSFSGAQGPQSSFPTFQLQEVERKPIDLEHCANDSINLSGITQDSKNNGYQTTMSLASQQKDHVHEGTNSKTLAQAKRWKRGLSWYLQRQQSPCPSHYFTLPKPSNRFIL